MRLTPLSLVPERLRRLSQTPLPLRCRLAIVKHGRRALQSFPVVVVLLPERFRVRYAFGGGRVAITLHALSHNGNAHYTEEGVCQPVSFFESSADAGPAQYVNCRSKPIGARLRTFSGRLRACSLRAGMPSAMRWELPRYSLGAKLRRASGWLR